MSRERFLVTGAFGCLGAWVVHELVGAGVDVVSFDIGNDDFRIRYLLDDGALARVTRVRGDIADPLAVREAVLDHGITNVLHLAALQIPACAANPSSGALANVVGTINVFEAVKNTPAADRPIVYASSVAAYDAIDDPAADKFEPSGRPSSHYGVFKFANEGNARVFARDDGLASIGLRPAVVYGVGRDQGKTSAPTAAMLAAARGMPFKITFSGSCQMQYAQDVARAFITASRTDHEGAAIVNLDAPSVDVQEIVEAIRTVTPETADRIVVSGDPLPFPVRVPDDGVVQLLGRTAATSLVDGVAETISRFRNLLASGRMDDRYGRK